MVHCVQESQVFREFGDVMNDTRPFELFWFSVLEDEQIFKFDEANNIFSAFWVDWHFRVVMTFQFWDQSLIDDSILVDHKDTLDWDHVVVYLFQPEVDGVL